MANSGINPASKYVHERFYGKLVKNQRVIIASPKHICVECEVSLPKGSVAYVWCLTDMYDGIWAVCSDCAPANY